jgi:hypothetical protein
LADKYVQEQQAQAAYVPKFTSPRAKAYPEGHQPSDMYKASLYNVKLANYMDEAVKKCNN